MEHHVVPLAAQEEQVMSAALTNGTQPAAGPEAMP